VSEFCTNYCQQIGRSEKNCVKIVKQQQNSPKKITKKKKGKKLFSINLIHQDSIKNGYDL
jgi:hypothetical protein